MVLAEHQYIIGAFLGMEPCEDGQVALWPSLKSPGGLYPVACGDHILTTDTVSGRPELMGL